MYKRSDGWWVDGKAAPSDDIDEGEDDESDDGMFDFDDMEHCEESSDTGNEGANIHHRYFAAAVVFRPT
jgi:hypothetical protein